MSILDELSSALLTTFPGASQRLDYPSLSAQSRSPGALLSLNCEYESGEVIIPRRGFSPAIALSVITKSLYNWRPGSANRLLRLEDNGATDTLIVRNLLSGGSGSDLYTLLSSISGVDGCVFAPQSTKLYVAFYTTTGYGAIQGRVWDGGDTSGTPNFDKLFQRPLLITTEMTISAASATPAAGEVPLTAGVHHLGAILVTKNGYETGLSPISTDAVFVPFELTADGSSVYLITLDPATTWPNWCYVAYIAMSTVLNTNRYYLIPGGQFSSAPALIATPGSTTNVTIRIAIDDLTLTAANSRDVEELRSLLQQDTSGNGPFNPSWIATGTDRVAYGGTIPDAHLVPIHNIYISEPANGQHITADQHTFQLPGGRSHSTATWLGKSIYIFGPNWTYSRFDNGDKPVLWPKVETIDEQIGTRFPHGIGVNTTRGWIWVADESGLYILRGGSYDRYPVTLDQGATDWARINWGAPASTLKVIDDVDSRQVLVAAPLDGALFSTHILAFDYSEGETFNRVKYSLWNLRAADGSALKPGGMCMAQSVAGISDPRQELWLGREETAGAIYRQKYSPEDAVTTIYNDNDVGINGRYQTPPFYWVDAVQNFFGGFFRMLGSGNISITALALDEERSAVLNSVTLTAAGGTAPGPGKNFLRKFRLNSSALSFLVTNGTVANAYVRLSRIQLKFRNWVKALIA